MNTIYELLKRMITTGNYEKADMQNKLDVFFMVGRITQDQYLELTEMINPKTAPVEPVTPAQPTPVAPTTDTTVQQ